MSTVAANHRKSRYRNSVWKLWEKLAGQEDWTWRRAHQTDIMLGGGGVGTPWPATVSHISTTHNDQNLDNMYTRLHQAPCQLCLKTSLLATECSTLKGPHFFTPVQTECTRHEGARSFTFVQSWRTSMYAGILGLNLCMPSFAVPPAPSLSLCLCVQRFSFILHHVLVFCFFFRWCFGWQYKD